MPTRTFSITDRLPKRRMFWKVRAMPLLGNLIGAQPEQRFALEIDLTFLRAVDAGQGVEEGGLACTVRADDADDLALLDAEVHFVDGDQAAEALDNL